MVYFVIISVLLIVGFLVLPKTYLRYVLSKSFPLPYSKILRSNVPAYSKMPTDLQLQLKRRIKQFLHQKTFVGCDGLVITDEIKVTIAGKACLLLLNRHSDVYPKLTHVLVYPSAFVAPRIQTNLGGVVTHTNQGLSGESWSDGRVILAWDQVAHNSEVEALGQDVILHEFAHQLDSETGSTNGAPVLHSAAAYQAWSQTMADEYNQLLHAVEHGEDTVIDAYGCTNPAEFFAVATEAFFKKSHALANDHPALFAQLFSFYRVDPRDWA